MAKSLLTFRNLSKTFPGVKALDGITFSVMQGEVHVLMGENGAGKSTLIKVLTGIVEPDAGSEVIWEGKSIVIPDPLASVRLGIAAIYQDFSLFENLTIAENIAIGLQIEKNKRLINWRQMHDISNKALKRVKLEISVDEKVQNISVAKQQMVAIARALAYDVKLLIMDEPTSCLSHSEVENLFAIIRELQSQGITILFISHKIEEVFAICDVITVLRDGKYKGTYKKDEIDENQLIEMMVGKEVTYVNYQKKKLNDPLLQVINLEKKGNFKDISFTLHRGEILGIIGLVGAGRTETVQALFGLNPPDSGEIRVQGKVVSIRSPMEAKKLSIGFVPENRQSEGLFLTQTISKNILVTIYEKVKERLLVNNKKNREIVRDWIKNLSIRPPDPDMPAQQLSGGNQQRVVIAKWLATEPLILIIDEPTNGIDVAAKEEIHRLLRELAEAGMGIIMVSSEIQEVIAVCDRILVMKNGRITAEMGGDVATQEAILNKAIL